MTVFAAIQNIPFTYMVCGVIWALAMGLAVGNYACSLVHRLPRGRLILDRKPYCGSCGKELAVKDLFPVISALLLKHRCRYCAAPFPKSHTWTELLVGLLFVLTFLQYNFGEMYLLIVTLGVFLITLAAIENNDRIIMGRILLCVIVFGALLRTLADHSIYGFFMGGLYGLILGAVLTRKDIKPVGHVYSLPPLAQLLAVGGVCVGDKGLPVFIVLFAGLYLAGRVFGKPPITIPFGLAVMAVVLYGNLFPPLAGGM